MAVQNVISTGVPDIFKNGTKTFTFNIVKVANSEGWGRLDPNVNGLIAPNKGANNDTSNTLTMSRNMPDGSMIPYFKDFWSKNPFYVRGINLRLSEASFMPSAIIFCTPNIFTGNIDKVICETAPLLSSGQYQEGILNLQTNIVCGRQTYIEIESGATITAGVQLSIDLIIPVNSSLEEAMYSFVSSDNAIE